MSMLKKVFSQIRPSDKARRSYSDNYFVIYGQIMPLFAPRTIPEDLARYLN